MLEDLGGKQKNQKLKLLLLNQSQILLFVSEANLRTNISDEVKHVEGYYLITPKTDLHMGYSRLVLLAREGVKLTIMNDCMAEDLPTIWVKLTSRGRKPLVIGGIYREFHHLLSPNPITQMNGPFR